MIYQDWKSREDARLAAIFAAEAHERLVAAPALPMLPLEAASHGRNVFATACVACHGPAGLGVAGLGRNLVDSDFVANLSDAEFATFIAIGRPFAQPVAMPPKGGHDELTRADLEDVVTYVRGLQDPRRMPELPAMTTLVVAPPSEADQARALEAAGGDADLAFFIASGTKLFGATCSACHGKDGGGIQGNGKALKNNAFIQGLDDDGLYKFLMKGRGPSDPGNTTGISMPAKGGNPALSEDDLLDIVAYLRTLQPKPAK